MKIHISPLTFLYFAVCLTCSHSLTVVAVCTAVLIHELTHLILLWWMGARASALTITPIGLSIERSGMLSHIEEVWLCLSAPLINLILAGGFAYFSLDRFTVEVNLCLGMINLLPIVPLDGGKALLAMLSHYASEEAARRIMGIVSAFFMLILWLLAVSICVVLNGSISLLLLVSGLFISAADFDKRYK